MPRSLFKLTYPTLGASGQNGVIGNTSGLLTRERDVDAAGRQCESDPLSGRHSLDNYAVLVTEARYSPTASYSCSRRDRDIVTTKICDIPQVAHCAAACDPRDPDINH